MGNKTSHNSFRQNSFRQNLGAQSRLVAAAVTYVGMSILCGFGPMPSTSFNNIVAFECTITHVNSNGSSSSNATSSHPYPVPLNPPKATSTSSPPTITTSTNARSTQEVSQKEEERITGSNKDSLGLGRQLPYLS